MKLFSASFVIPNVPVFQIPNLAASCSVNLLNVRRNSMLSIMRERYFVTDLVVVLTKRIEIVSHLSAFNAMSRPVHACCDGEI